MWKILARNELTIIASPIRRQLLDALSEPTSASGLARRLGTSRQRVGYHMRALEQAGFLELVEERQQRGCTEQLYRAKRINYVLELDGVTSNRDADKAFRQTRDRFSWATLMGIAARMLRDLTFLRDRADKRGKNLPTLGIDTAVTFASPASRKHFTTELTAAVEHLVRKYHSENFADGRRYRLVLGAYPYPGETKTREKSP